MKKLLLLFLLLFTLSACGPSGPYVFKNTSFNYSIFSEFDLVIQKLPESIHVISILLDDEEVDLSNIIHDKSGLKLKSSYIKSLPVGDYLFTITTAEGNFSLELKIIDTNRPYMISKSSVESDFLSNQIFIFELFGGRIKSVSGYDITSSDYTIRGNELTIKKGFIRNAFDSNESLESLVLGYTLEVDTHIVIGYIFITQKS
jgi:hypothetical protein